jgi:hypothetical protein
MIEKLHDAGLNPSAYIAGFASIGASYPAPNGRRRDRRYRQHLRRRV